MANLLVVDPDVASAASLNALLVPAGHVAKIVSTSAEALKALEGDLFDLVFVEMRLPDGGGMELLGHLTKRWPGLPIVMVAANSTVAEAVSAMRSGAADFVVKPMVADEIRYVTTKVLAGAAPSAAEPPISIPAHDSKLIGQSDPMRQVHEMVGRAAASSATVLIRGESGTGKELVARAVHERSARRDQPFVKIDCTSLPDSLLESELFGYERGAFTGAVARKPGRIELAEGGTLFLDEIGEISAAMQAKLLRLLQAREFERLGGKQTLRIDVRFILATHRDLETMVKNGTFRQDLFYRLNVVPLWLPPLRARRDDISLLVHHFSALFASANDRPGLTFSPEALRFLRSQRWPGNVRQLENLIERLVVLADGPSIGIEAVQREFVQRPQFTTQATGTQGAPPSSARVSSALALDEAVRRAEKEALLRALERTGGNRSVAARVLGVSRATLYNKLKDLGIDAGGDGRAQ
jgi:two-component system response regulator AtoC